MALVPVVTVLHELAHYAVGRAFDFPGLEFRLTSVPDTAGASGFPEWQRGVKSAAGPWVNWLFVGVSCFVAWRRPVAAWASVVGLTAAIAPAIDSGVLLLAAVFGKSTAGVDVDEANASRFFHLPLTPTAAVLFALTVTASLWLVTRLPRGTRASTVSAVVVGAVAGFFLFSRLA
jgi:hypothetical protein